MVPRWISPCRSLRRRALRGCVAVLVVVTAATATYAVGLPIDGYMPRVGLGLTDEFKDENDLTFWFADVSNSPGGTWLSGTAAPYFDTALVDTGASVVLLTDAAATAMDIEGNGFGGTETFQVGGASGTMIVTTQDPLGIYAAGLGDRTAAGANLVMDQSAMRGLTSFSLATMPAESELPNVFGLPVVSQFATAFRMDQPQIFELNGATIRSPHIDFLPLGSGDTGIGPVQGVVQKATFELRPTDPFLTAPQYIFNFMNILEDLALTENPTYPSLMQGGLFLDIDITNGEASEEGMQFLFDTGASVTAVSEALADQLGFDVLVDEPDFYVPLVGSGGLIERVPGFFADQLEISVLGGEFIVNDVPIVVTELPDTGDPGNVLDGIIGTNLFTDRNLVIDATPSLGGGGSGPSLYISQPVTETHTWNAQLASGAWHTPTHWTEPGTPEILWVVDLANVSGANQEAVLADDSTVNRVVISGASGAAMTLRVTGDSKLTTFGGIAVEPSGVLHVEAGSTVDAQFIDVAGGEVRGSGAIRVDDLLLRDGTLSPGTTVGQLAVTGRFSTQLGATLAIELGGLEPGTEFDQLLVDGVAILGGALDVSLVDLGDGLLQPAPGNRFEVLTADQVIGRFDTLSLPGIADWDIHYSLTSVELEVLALALIAGDMDGDGDVDFDDIPAFMLGLSDPSAYFDRYGVAAALRGDLDHSGTVDVYDVTPFVGILNGVASAGGLHAVPEPALPVLVLTGLVAVWLRPRRRGAN